MNKIWSFLASRLGELSTFEVMVRFREVVLTAANQRGISLATPLRHELLRSPGADG